MFFCVILMHSKNKQFRRKTMKITTILFGILATTTVLSSASVPATKAQVESQLITIAQPMVISVKR